MPVNSSLNKQQRYISLRFIDEVWWINVVPNKYKMTNVVKSLASPSEETKATHNFPT